MGLYRCLRWLQVSDTCGVWHLSAFECVPDRSLRAQQQLTNHPESEYFEQKRSAHHSDLALWKQFSLGPK